MSAFWSRIVVAAVFLPIVLYVVWLGGWWLLALALAGALLALHELYGLARALRPLVLAGYAGAVLVLLGVQLGGLDWMLGGMLGTVVLAFLLWGVSTTRQSATVAMGTTLLGVVWVPLALGYLVLVRDLPEHGRLAIFTVLLAVFADDTLAYFVGRMVGRHKMSPAISPGKSWEGFVAGATAAVAVTFFALYEDRDTFLPIWQALVLGAVIALAATIGDLFESAVKRDLGAKDSGRLLAGHGGVLDRLDSLLWAAPAAFYVLLAFDAL